MLDIIKKSNNKPMLDWTWDELIEEERIVRQIQLPTSTSSGRTHDDVLFRFEIEFIIRSLK